MAEWDIDAVYRLYAGRLRAKAGAHVDPADAEDAVADAFLRLMERGTRESVWAFLYQRVRRTVRGRPRMQALDGIEVHRDAMEGVVDMVAVAQALQALPAEDRRIAELRWVEGYTLAETARSVRRPLSTVADRLAAIRRRVDEHMGRVGLLLVDGIRRRRLQAAVEHGAASLAVATAAVAVMALQPAPVAPVPPVTDAPAPGWWAVRDATMAAPTTAPRVEGAAIVHAASTGTGAMPPGRVSTVTPGRGALLGRSETPQDTHLLSVASGGGYTVMLGQGRTCSCTVLFRSADAGRSWEVTDGPARGTQVAIAADYPQDPRIVVGQPAGAAALDAVAAAWGEPFAPLPAPPGQAAIAGGGVFVATSTGVLRVVGGVPTVLLTHSATSLPAVLALAPGGVDVLAPAGSVAVGSAPTTTAGLWSCTAPSCSLIAETGLANPRALAVDGSAVMASSAAALVVSGDGGATYRAVVVPGVVAGLAAAAGAGWVLLSDGRVLRLVGADTAVDAPPTPAAAIAGAAGRAVVLSSGTGYACRLAAGWATSC